MDPSSRLRVRVALAAALLTAPLLPAVPAPAVPAAASVPTGALTEVTDFGANPSGLRMHVYLPATRPARPALLVVLHYCSGSGPDMFGLSDYAAYADRYGFVAVYPSASREDGCFDVFGDALVRGGGGNPDSVVSMVRYAQATWGTDARRTFAVGYSSGAELVSELLATYPDVFAAGSIMAGSPFACYVTPEGGWNDQCESGATRRSAKVWGDLVRAADPQFRGTRPRVQLFHGTADTTIAYSVLAEELKQWSNVLKAKKLDVAKPRQGWTRTRYQDPARRIAVEAYVVKGGTHAIAWTEDDIERYPITFFGLNKR